MDANDHSTLMSEEQVTDISKNSNTIIIANNEKVISARDEKSAQVSDICQESLTPGCSKEEENENIVLDSDLCQESLKPGYSKEEENENSALNSDLCQGPLEPGYSKDEENENSAQVSDPCQESLEPGYSKVEEKEVPNESLQQLQCNMQEENEADQNVTFPQSKREGDEQTEVLQNKAACQVESDDKGYSSDKTDFSNTHEKVIASINTDVSQEVSRELSDTQDTRHYEIEVSDASEEKCEVVEENESSVDHPTMFSSNEEEFSIKESQSTAKRERNEEGESVKDSSDSKSRGTQTTLQLLDSSIFREFSLDVATMQVEIGLMTVDSLQELDPEIDDWPLLLVSQLRLRDNVINTLNTMLTDVLDKGRRLEEDVDYLKLKILDLKQQVKRNKRNKKIFSTQTTDEDFAAAWSKWYAGGYQYYSQEETSKMYSSTWEYVQQPTISPATQIVNESALPSVEEAVLELQADGKSDVCNKCYSDVNKHKVNDTGEEEDVGNLKTHCGCTQKTKDKERNTAKHKRNKAKKHDKILDKKIESDILGNTKLVAIDSIKESYAVEKNSQTSLKDDEEYCKADEPRLSDKKEAAHGWDNSGDMSILDQVKAAANEAVQGSGYVFQEELGLYYDYSTQYYYNAETGLYYDPKTGTYFYYDHASQAYQFHSQVAIDEKPAKRGKRKDDADREDSEGKRVKRIRKAKERNEEEREEGECTDSGEEEELEQEEEEEEELKNEEAAEECIDREETVHVPPSLRLMVIESASERVKVGTLHLVTLDGGTVGREAKNLVQLPDLNISKVHAEISYRSEGPDDHHYYLKDLGSNNGTFVNDTRLSEPRETSQEVELGHGWMLQFGPVKVKCHIHPGLLTCNECEPGLVNANHSSHDPGSSVVSYKNAKTREKARKKELQAMKKKYALTSSTGAPVTSGDYNDRADKRRKEVGSDNPYEKTEVASTEVALRDNNKGFALLQKMGWSEGQSLGKSQKGIKQPIQPESVVGRAGFGLVVSDATPNVAEKKRKKVLQITKQRYNQT